MEGEGKRMSAYRKIFGSLVIFAIVMCFQTACSFQESFYQKGSGWDYVRFPLLEPYYAIYISDEYKWEISLQDGLPSRNFKYFSAILDVEKIAVDRGVIMVYTPYSESIYVSPTQEKELHWFVLVPGQAELGFETEEEFVTQIMKYDLGQPSWQEPISILQTYDQTGCLDWIPECK